VGEPWKGGDVTEDTGLRVLTWNVHDLLGDPLAVRRVLTSARADVVCLQEGHRLVRSRPRLAALARRAGLLFVDGGRVSAGTAMLCSPRTVVTAVSAFPLPTRRFPTRPRGAVIATVSLPGGAPLQVACVHLGLRPQERAEHVGILLDRLRQTDRDVADGAVVVAGDLNEPPDGPAWRTLATLVGDPAPDAPRTFPARAPDRRIDAVLAGAGVEVVEYGRWQPAERDVRLASDHYPVLAVVRPR
jgi:endonuclease/exonuclease/phosphatase family metal-dependent hydrolase